MIGNRSGKRVVFVLLGVLIAYLGISAIPRLYAAVLAYVYPPEKNILVSRSFEPDDLATVSSGDTITVTVDVTNDEDVALRGFYYSDQVPSGWTVNTVGVSVIGSSVADYVYTQGYADEIYTGFTPHRWALEMPQGGGVFSPTHPIPASGGAAQIVYTMAVGGGSGSDYVTEQDAWAGWLETVDTAVFGYQEIASPLEVDFTAVPRSGEAPLTVEFSDLTSGGPVAWSWDFGDGSPVSVQQHPTHTYTVTGVYTVTLAVTRTEPAASDSAVKPSFITVTTPLLRADFTAEPRSGPPPLTVEFTDLSTGAVLTRVWQFGDGGTALLPGSVWLSDTASLPSPTHTYTEIGYYTVTLTVQSAQGSDTLERPRYIRVTGEVYVYLPVILKQFGP